MGKRGPSPSGRYSSKGATLSARITPQLRKRLDMVAKENGTSLNREVERRLEQSFRNARDTLRREAGAETEYFLLRICAEAFGEIDQFTGESWLTDRFTFDVLLATIVGFLTAYRPPGEARVPERASPLKVAEHLPEAERAGLRAAFQKITPQGWGTIFAQEILARLSTDSDGLYAQAAALLNGIKTGGPDGLSALLAATPDRFVTVDAMTVVSLATQRKGESK